ncbi:Type II toxin-antitoxin system HicA family toxin [uncultured Gammaproteobacteria bacterium]
MPITSKDAIRLIQATGWAEVRQSGSHKQFKHPTIPGTVTVPHPKKDLSTGVIKDIQTKTCVRLR